MRRTVLLAVCAEGVSSTTNLEKPRALFNRFPEYFWSVFEAVNRNPGGHFQMGLEVSVNFVERYLKSPAKILESSRAQLKERAYAHAFAVASIRHRKRELSARGRPKMTSAFSFVGDLEARFSPTNSPWFVAPLYSSEDFEHLSTPF
jgi:hypothetical protein